MKFNKTMDNKILVAASIAAVMLMYSCGKSDETSAVVTEEIELPRVEVDVAHAQEVPQMKEYTAALEAFQAGMQLKDTAMMQTLSFNEIVAYEFLGEYRQAQVLMENYLKNYPDDEQAKREYEFLSTR